VSWAIIDKPKDKPKTSKNKVEKAMVRFI